MLYNHNRRLTDYLLFNAAISAVDYDLIKTIDERILLNHLILLSTSASFLTKDNTWPRKRSTLVSRNRTVK